MASDKVREMISRTIDGVETLVNATSGEIFIDVPADTPQYIQVEAGATIQEGDVRTQLDTELDSPSLRKWTIEQIGSKTVIGTDQETGEQHEWERETLEEKLAIGEFSTQLTDFDRANVTGDREASKQERPSDSVDVTVVVYGNDGQQFTQAYRLVENDDSDRQWRAELIEADPDVESFEPALKDRFDRAVEEALRNEGYVG